MQQSNSCVDMQPVILISNVMTGIAALGLGLSGSYGAAISCRIVGGLFNGSGVYVLGLLVAGSFSVHMSCCLFMQCIDASNDPDTNAQKYLELIHVDESCLRGVMLIRAYLPYQASSYSELILHYVPGC